MIKLLVFDIDGTLRDERYGISDHTQCAIHQCRTSGYHLAICTGRNRSSIQEDVKILDFPHVIAGGGNYVESNHQIIKKTSFDNHLIKRLLKQLQQQTCGIALEGIDDIYMNQAACDILQDMQHKKLRSLSADMKRLVYQKGNIQYHDNLQTYQNTNIHKICLWCDERIFQMVKHVLEDAMELAQMDNQIGYYEIICRGSNKSDAINVLCKHLNIDMQEVLAFGDGMNDASMLEACGIGIAMGNSDKRLFAFADGKCEAVDDDGVYKELQRRNIIKGGSI